MNAPFVGTLALAALVAAPGMLFFLVAWPAWDTMYWFADVGVPPWLAPVFAALAVAATVGGFHAVHRALRRGRMALALALPAILMAPAGAICLAWPGRWLHVGPAAGGEPNFLASGVPWALVVLGAALVMGSAVVLAVSRQPESGRSR